MHTDVRTAEAVRLGACSQTPFEESPALDIRPPAQHRRHMSALEMIACVLSHRSGQTHIIHSQLGALFQFHIRMAGHD